MKKKYRVLSSSKLLNVKAGQFYWTKTPIGKKLILIEQIRWNGGEPFAFAHEVNKNGTRRKGVSKNGIPNGTQFVSNLVWDKVLDKWRMSNFYNLWK